MSCSFGVSPRPLTISAFSVKAVSLLILAFSECRSPGAVVLRYAFQLVRLEAAALASAFAVRVRALQPAEIGAVAFADARHVETFM